MNFMIRSDSVLYGRATGGTSPLHPAFLNACFHVSFSIFSIISLLLINVYSVFFLLGCQLVYLLTKQGTCVLLLCQHKLKLLYRFKIIICFYLNIFGKSGKRNLPYRSRLCPLHFYFWIAHIYLCLLRLVNNLFLNFVNIRLL